MKKQHVTLSEAHREYLTNLLKAGKTPARTYKRARVLLELDRGRTFTEVAEMVGVVVQTASTWATKYETNGLGALNDKPRPGRPRTIDALQRAAITALACSKPPEGYQSWSLRLLADKAVELELVDEISRGTVREVLKKTNSNRT
jgi:putative transposase